MNNNKQHPIAALTPEERASIDIDELLAERRQVAVTWCVDDVLSVRPDLTEGQAWDVLVRCLNRHDCEFGFTWNYIEDVAFDLYPTAENDKEEA